MPISQTERPKVAAAAIEAAADAQKVAVLLTFGGSSDLMAALAAKQLEAKARKIRAAFVD